MITLITSCYLSIFAGQAVPPPPSIADFLNEHIGYLKSDFTLILLQAKFVGGIIIGTSFFLGFLFRGLFTQAAQPKEMSPTAKGKKAM